MSLLINGNFYIFFVVNFYMGFQESRYLVDCLNSIDELFDEQNRQLSELNRIEGGLIVLGTFDATIDYSNKKYFSISKKPTDDLKIKILKNTICEFNNYIHRQHLRSTTQDTFSSGEILNNIKHASTKITQNENLTKYVSPSKIRGTNNLFLYFKDSLFEDDELKDDIYINWFLEEMPVSGNLRIGDELDRILSLSGLSRKKNSKSNRNKILCEEYDYLILQTKEVKKDFDLRYDLSKP